MGPLSSRPQQSCPYAFSLPRSRDAVAGSTKSPARALGQPPAAAAWKMTSRPEALVIRMGEVFGTRFTITDETLRIKRALRKAEVIANDDMETVEAAARAPDAEEAGFCVIAVTRRGERWVVSEMPTAAAAQSLAKAIRGRWKISESPLALQPFNPRLEADRERHRSAWRSWRRARRGIAMAPLVLVGSALTAMLDHIALGPSSVLDHAGDHPELHQGSWPAP